MYSVRYTFYPRAQDVESFYGHALSGFLADLFRNGQILRGWAVAQLDDGVEVSCAVPETDSLSPRHYGVGVGASFEKLLQSCSRRPDYRLVGRNVEAGNACECVSSSSYILFTTFVQTEPPVICGDCGDHVPLYRLPCFGTDQDHGAVLRWERIYQACDALYMESSVGEQFGLRQIRSPKSSLSVEGMEICRDLSTKTGKPFYYYLWTSPERPRNTCPSCGAKWHYGEPIACWMYRRCDVCGLVSG